MWFEKMLAIKEYMNHGLDMTWYLAVGEVALLLMTNQINQ
jgi:hypothetical protein